MKTTNPELQKSLSGFSLDHDGSFSSSIKLPMDRYTLTTYYSMCVDDINGVQWWFQVEVSLPFPASDPKTGRMTIEGEPELHTLSLKVKHGDQEVWKDYDLTSHLQDVSVPADLTDLFTRVMCCGLYTPLDRTGPAKPKKVRTSPPKALVVDASAIMEALEDAGYEAEFDFHDEPVLTVSKHGEIFEDMYVYLEFKELDKTTAEMSSLVLFGGSRETLSEKKNAGDFDTSEIGTVDDLLKALGESFDAWQASMKSFQ
jgi:hypothetical protein